MSIIKMTAKYNTALTFYITLKQADSTDHATSAEWTPAAGDVKFSEDGAAFANIGTLPVYTNDQWVIVVAASELVGARTLIKIEDASSPKVIQDTSILIETFGNASATFAIDYSDTVRMGLTALPNAAADAAGGLPISDAGGLDLDGMDTKLDDVQGATFNTSTDSLEAIRNRGDTAWTTGGGGSGSSSNLLQTTTIATLASQTSFTLTAGSADDNPYNNQLIIVTDQSTTTQKAVGRISDYTGSTKTVTLEADPGIFTMAVGDTVDIIAVANHIETVDTATTVTNNVGVSSLTSAAITDIWETYTLTEEYHAKGAAGKPNELMYAILSALTEFAIAGTTITAKKLNGSTTSMTFTLDDATNPTSRTRAT